MISAAATAIESLVQETTQSAGAADNGVFSDSKTRADAGFGPVFNDALQGGKSPDQQASPDTASQAPAGSAHDGQESHSPQAISDRNDPQGQNKLTAAATAQQQVPATAEPAQLLIPTGGAAAASDALRSATSGMGLPPLGQPLPLTEGIRGQAGELRSRLTGTDKFGRIAGESLSSRIQEPGLELDRSIRSLTGTAARDAEFRGSQDGLLNNLVTGKLTTERFSLDKFAALLQPAGSPISTPVAAPESSTPLPALQPTQTGTFSFSAAAGNLIESQPATDAAKSQQHTESMAREQLLTPHGSNRWHADFAGKLRILSQGNVSAVELNLHPAELGAIDIRIQALDEGTIINFYSSNAATREIIDGSLPRLRELLWDSGIQLQHGDVSDRESETGHSRPDTPASRTGEITDDAMDLNYLVQSRQKTTSMIDHYV